MAITSVPTFFYPAPLVLDQSSPTITALTMNASGDRVGFVFRIPKTGTLSKVHFRTGTVGNNPDNGIRISFQDIDLTTGFPDGVVDQYRDITGAISSNTWQSTGIISSDGTDVGTKRSVTRNDWLGVVFDFVSFVALDSIGISYMATNVNGHHTNTAWVADAADGSYSKTRGNYPLMVLEYDDATYAQFPLMDVFPFSTWGVTNYNSGSTPDEYALRFTVPFEMQCCGAWVRSDINAAGDVDIVLYNNAGTADRTVTIDGETTVENTVGLHYVYWGDYTLSTGNTYRLALKPTTVTNCSIDAPTVSAAGYLDAWPPGSTWYLSTRTDAGAWTDTTTQRPHMGLILNGIASGTSGGAFTFVG